MVELEQYKYQWNQYADQLEELRKAFDIQAKKERIEEIHTQIYDNILNDINIKNYNYDPHITLGCVNSTDEKVETDEEFETVLKPLNTFSRNMKILEL